MWLKLRNVAVLAFATSLLGISASKSFGQDWVARYLQPTSGGNVSPSPQNGLHYQPAQAVYYEISDEGDSSQTNGVPSADPSGSSLWSDASQVDYLGPYMTETNPLHGFFFQYDHLVWSLTKPDVDIIGGVSDDHIDGRVHGADRFDFGHSEGDRGWFSSVLFGKAFRTIGTSIYTAANPLTESDALVATEAIDVSGAEWNRSFRRTPQCEVFLGVRYFDYRSFYDFTGSGLTLAAAGSTVSKNQIVGPQFGFRWNGAARKFILNVEGRFTPGYNRQSVSVQAAVPGPVTPIVRRDVTGEFSPLGEIRADAILPINRFMAFRLGYTGIIAGGMSIPNPIVVYPVPDAGVANVDHMDAVYISAFTAGLQINR